MSEPITPPHLGGAYECGDANTIMPDVWGYLLVKYEIKSVLDVGCGFGHAMKWFAEHGLCEVKGLEGWKEAIAKSIAPPGSVLEHDFEDRAPLPVAQPFDLGWCAELLEHVDSMHLFRVFEALHLCRYVVATHAEPGQAGHHHVNCQTTDYWIDQFRVYGFEHRAEETALLRRTDRWRAPWGRRTLMFYERKR